MALPGLISACSSAAVRSILVLPNLLPENTTFRLAGERRISAAADFRWRVATAISWWGVGSDQRASNAPVAGRLSAADPLGLTEPLAG